MSLIHGVVTVPLNVRIRAGAGNNKDHHNKRYINVTGNVTLGGREVSLLKEDD